MSEEVVGDGVSPPTPPDEVRCTRRSGSNWRCKNRRFEDHVYCERHYLHFQKKKAQKNLLAAAETNSQSQKRSKKRSGVSETETETNSQNHKRSKKQKNDVLPIDFEETPQQLSNEEEVVSDGDEDDDDGDGVGDPPSSIPPSDEQRCICRAGRGWRCKRRSVLNSLCRKHLKYYRKSWKTMLDANKKENTDELQIKDSNTIPADVRKPDQGELAQVNKTAETIHVAMEPVKMMNTNLPKPCNRSKKEKASPSLIGDPKTKTMVTRGMTRSGKSTNLDTPNTEVEETTSQKDICGNSTDGFICASKGMSDYPASSNSPGNILGVLDGNKSGDLPKFADSSLSPLSKGAQGDSSGIQTHFLEKRHDVQSSPHNAIIFSDDEINQLQTTAEKQTTTTLETAWQSTEMLSESSEAGPKYKSPRREVAEVVQAECTLKGSELTTTEALNTTEGLPPLSLSFVLSYSRIKKRNSHDKQLPALSNNAITLIEASLRGFELSKPTHGKGSTSSEEHEHTGDQFDRAIGRETESGVQSFDKIIEVASEEGTLPFTKSYPVWENIQTMEIFSLMPQSPHFQPLKEHNELLREGIAVGYMLSFADLAARIRNAKIDEPKSFLENSLNALTNFEAVGFNVVSLRSRLEELVRAKTKQEELDGELKKVEGKILEEEDEKESLNTLADEIDQKLKELQESLTKTKQQWNMVLMQKQTKDTCVVTLRKRVQEIQEELEGINLDFSRAAATPW